MSKKTDKKPNKKAAKKKVGKKTAPSKRDEIRRKLLRKSAIQDADTEAFAAGTENGAFCVITVPEYYEEKQMKELKTAALKVPCIGSVLIVREGVHVTFLRS